MASITRRSLATGLLCLLLVSTPALAGCLEDDTAAPTGQGQTPETNQQTGVRINLTGSQVVATDAVTWNGTELSRGDTESIPFRLGDPEASDGPVAHELVVSATWDPYRLGGSSDEDTASPGGDMSIRLKDADGQVLSESSPVWFSATTLLQEPEPGSYVVEVNGTRGSTAYVGSIHVQPAPGPVGSGDQGDSTDGSEGVATNGSSTDLLPDLVTMPVIHLTRERPYTSMGQTVGGTGPADDSAGRHGCSPYETGASRAADCLRLTNAIGNIGEGPLELRMSFEDTVGSLTPAGGSFTQIIYQADGSTRESDVGAAEFHAGHQHYHKNGMANYTLYAYDAANDTRGEVVREGHKSSWCLVDMGLVDPSAGHRTEVARYPLSGSRAEPQEGSNCLAATPEQDMVTGLSSGWYDMYEWNQPHQYIEISGLADGTYELVSQADPGGQLLEADTGNNAGGVVFEWSNGEATVLQRWSDALGPGPGDASRSQG